MAAKMVSNRRLIGAGILVAVAGAFLSLFTGLFSGFGGGGGEGDGSNSDNVEVNSSTHNTETEIVPPAEQLSSDGMLDIIIDDEKYLVKQKDGTRIEMSLADIVERAPQMPGNADGKLVKVSLKRSSVFEAERKLKEDLAAAGVNETQIDWVEETLE